MSRQRNINLSLIPDYPECVQVVRDIDHVELWATKHKGVYHVFKVKEKMSGTGKVSKETKMYAIGSLELRSQFKYKE